MILRCRSVPGLKYIILQPQHYGTLHLHRVRSTCRSATTNRTRAVSSVSWFGFGAGPISLASRDDTPVNEILTQAQRICSSTSPNSSIPGPVSRLAKRATRLTKKVADGFPPADASSQTHAHFTSVLAQSLELLEAHRANTLPASDSTLMPTTSHEAIGVERVEIEIKDDVEHVLPEDLAEAWSNLPARSTENGEESDDIEVDATDLWIEMNCFFAAVREIVDKVLEIWKDFKRGGTNKHLTAHERNSNTAEMCAMPT